MMAVQLDRVRLAACPRPGTQRPAETSVRQSAQRWSIGSQLQPHASATRARRPPAESRTALAALTTAFHPHGRKPSPTRRPERSSARARRVAEPRSSPKSLIDVLLDAIDQRKQQGRLVRGRSCRLLQKREQLLAQSQRIRHVCSQYATLSGITCRTPPRRSARSPSRRGMT